MSSLIVLPLILLFHIFYNQLDYLLTLKILIDNIFSNIISPEAISGNFTSTISDHLSQFMIVPDVFYNPPSNKTNTFERVWSNFDQKNFILHYFSIDWNVALKLDEQNVNYSTESFLNKTNSLLSNYTPLKKINKYTLKFPSKPWITTGLQKSVSIKNKFLTNFIRKKILLKRQNFICNTKTTETYYQPF